MAGATPPAAAEACAPAPLPREGDGRHRSAEGGGATAPRFRARGVHTPRRAVRRGVRARARPTGPVPLTQHRHPLAPVVAAARPLATPPLSKCRPKTGAPTPSATPRRWVRRGSASGAPSRGRGLPPPRPPGPRPAPARRGPPRPPPPIDGRARRHERVDRADTDRPGVHDRVGTGRPRTSTLGAATATRRPRGEKRASASSGPSCAPTAVASAARAGGRYALALIGSLPAETLAVTPASAARMAAAVALPPGVVGRDGRVDRTPGQRDRRTPPSPSRPCPRRRRRRCAPRAALTPCGGSATAAPGRTPPLLSLPVSATWVGDGPPPASAPASGSTQAAGGRHVCISHRPEASVNDVRGRGRRRGPFRLARVRR